MRTAWPRDHPERMTSRHVCAASISMLPLSSTSTGLTMIRLLTDMPAGVLGLEAVGDVEKEDYEKVIVPAVEEAIAREGKIRVVYVLGHEFDEYEAGAVWEDLKLGVRHPVSSEADRPSHRLHHRPGQRPGRRPSPAPQRAARPLGGRDPASAVVRSPAEADPTS
jgi:hypothetical protein